MSEKQVQVSDDITDLKFRERITAFIGLGIMITYGIVAAFAAYAAVTGDTNSTSFGQLKDLLTFLSGLVGTVVGYYFGRVGVEKRAEAAESMVQMGETVRREAERQAAQALAKLDVEGLAREAAEKGRELAEQAQEKAEQVAQVAQEAREQVETRMGQMNEVVTEVSQGMQSMRERVQSFKEGLAQVGEATGLDSLVLGGEEEGGAPPVDVQELDNMAADMDALLQKLEQVQH